MPRCQIHYDSFQNGCPGCMSMPVSPKPGNATEVSILHTLLDVSRTLKSMNMLLEKIDRSLDDITNDIHQTMKNQKESIRYKEVEGPTG